MKQTDFISTVTQLLGEFGFLLPEFTLIGGSLVVILFDLIYKGNYQSMVKTGLSVFILILTAFCTHFIQHEGDFLNGVLYQTLLIRKLKIFFLFVTGAIFLFPNSHYQRSKGEYHYLILMILLGSFFLIQTRNLLLFYVSLELVSITSYVLITFSFHRRGFEGGLKYLLFGAMSSGLMLYGLSLWYGFSGTLDIADVSSFVQLGDNMTWLNLSVILFFAGILFKLSLVPFHIWSPDAYESGPTSVVAFISVLPKVAVLVFFFHFLKVLPSSELGSMDWRYVLSLLAVVSMFFGNLSALGQNNAKRMMAYSSIAHSGTLLTGVIASTSFGFEALIFYSVVYGLMNVGVFYFVDWMEGNNIDRISDLVGLGSRFPVVGVSISIVLVSLVGLPPTGGFSAKLLIFSSVWDLFVSTDDAYLLWLFGLGILNSAISLFYYLKIPYYLFLKPANQESSVVVNGQSVLFMTIVSVALLLMFFMSDRLFNILF